MMECKHKVVLSSQLIKSTEVSSSNAMELEGFIRCREDLESKGLSVSSVTTDRHASIARYVREDWKTTKHYFDTWHISKGRHTIISY